MIEGVHAEVRLNATVCGEGFIFELGVVNNLGFIDKDLIVPRYATGEDNFGGSGNFS